MLGKIINKYGYVDWPLLKLYGMYLSRFLLTNLCLVSGNLDDSKVSNIYKLKQKFDSFLELIYPQTSKKNVQHLLEIALKIIARPFGFNDEIRWNKWFNYGIEINALPRITSEALSYYFDDPCLVLTQIIFLATTDHEQTIKTFIESYSIDQSMYKIYLNVIMRPDEYTHWVIDSTKDVSNLRQMLYLLNLIISNDRQALYFWNSKHEFLHYEYDQKIAHTMEERFEKTAKYEAIHALVRCNDSNIKAILKKCPKQMAESEIFEKAFNDYSRCTTDRDGKKIFSLDKKHIGCYSSFYYKNINEHSEAIKTFDAFYKTKETKNSKSKKQDKSKSLDPLNIENWSLKFYIALLREAFLMTDIPLFLINLVKYKDNYEFVDDDVEEYAFQILKVLTEYAHFVKWEQPDNPVVEKLANLYQAQSKFIQSLSENNINKGFLTAFTIFFGSESNEMVSNKKEERKSQEDKTKQKKQMMEKKKTSIMNKMKLKRAALTEKYTFDTGVSSNNESMSSISEQDISEVSKCQQWYEPLYSEEFSDKPYGYLASVIKTKLLYHSYQQTYYKQKEVDLRMTTSDSQRKSVEKLEFTGESLMNCGFLEKYWNGLVVQTCKHMIHYECLNNFKVQNAINRTGTILIEDMGVGEFFCPYCKRYSNTILPPWKELIELGNSNLSFSDMMSYDDKKQPKKETQISALLSLFKINFSQGKSASPVKSSVLSMLLDIVNVIRQKCVDEKDKKDILPVDIQTKKLEIVNSVINYVNHWVQLVDAKSLSWVLNEKDKIRSLILASQVLSSFSNSHSENDIPVIFEDEPIKTSLLELNISSLAVISIQKLYFQTSLEGVELKNSIISKILKVLYSFHLLQISAKILYEKHSFNISDPKTTLSMSELINVLKNKDINLTVSGQPIDLETRFTEGSLSFLRKVVAIVILTKGIEKAEEANKNFSCDPKNELLMLMNLLGWLEDDTNDFDFYHIIEQVQAMKSKDQISMIKNFKEYFDDQCGLNSMEVDLNDKYSQDQEMEEEKISTEHTSVSKVAIKRDAATIPEILYLITPDYYFTLPNLPNTLEGLTKIYYKKNCSLCMKCTKRGAICLTCQDYFCIAKCNLDLTHKDYKIGTLTRHSTVCSLAQYCQSDSQSEISDDINEGTWAYIEPVEGKIFYLHNGLSIEVASPYVNKYGECFDENDKSFDTYALNTDNYTKIRDHFLNFEIANLVITKRATKTKVYRQNVL